MPIVLAVALVLTTACSATTANQAATPTTTPAAPTTTVSPASGTTPPSTTSPTAGTAVPASAATGLEVTSDDAFYAVPTPLPSGPHGTLVRYLKVDDLVPGATTYKIMYLSESLRQQPIVVTGLAVIPTAAAPAGGRITLAEAHGTTGVADECAPSKKPASSEIKQLGTVGVANGWAVTGTDYEGLGTPGRHPYLVGPSEGRSVIDSVLAAASLPGAALGHRIVIAGYSQGGHGALWANEVAATWAPDLEVVGTFAGAPATELNLIIPAGRTLPIGGFVLSIIAGYEAAYADADPALILTDKGMSLLGSVDTGCIGAVFKAAAGVAPADLMKADGAETPPWKARALENNPGQVATKGPILIVHSDQDDTVPVALSAVLHDRMCTHGQVVERRVLVGGGNHGAAAVPAYTQGIAWLKDLLDGKPATSDCPPPA